MKACIWLLPVIWVLPASGAWTLYQTEVDVFANLTDQGQKAGHPDSTHPVFYLPVISDFMPVGGAYPRERSKLSENAIAHRVALALSRQGYYLAHLGLRVNAQKEVAYADGTVVTVPEVPNLRRPIILNQPGDIPLTMAMLESASGRYSLRIGDRIGHALSPFLQVLRTVDPVHGPVMQGMPEIALAIQYGVMGATMGDLGGTAAEMPDFNIGPMIALIAGDSIKGDAFTLKFEDVDDIIQRTKSDRYFIIVTAYDFRSYIKDHKKTQLWRTRMSLPSTLGMDFGRALPILLNAGESRLGRQSTHPEFSTVPLEKGRVEIGTPEVIDYQEVPTPPPDVGSDTFMPFHFGAKR